MLSIAQGVWSSPRSKLDQLLPNLRLISGVMGRKSVTYLDYLYCWAEEWFARGGYLIKFQSYGITNVQGRGRNGLTILEIFLGHFIWTPLLNYFCWGSWAFLFITQHFLKEDHSMSFLNWIFSEGIFWRILTLLQWIGTQWRFWAEVVVELSSESGWQHSE